MATAYKILGQSAPNPTTWTTLYGPASGVQAVISTITICNRSASARTYRIALRLDDGALVDKHYLAYDVPIAANDTTALTLGITMRHADKLDIYGSTADLTFQAFGSEITA